MANEIVIDCSYGFVYSSNNSLKITTRYDEDVEEELIEVYSEYGEKMFSHEDFEEVVKFLNELLNDKYAYEGPEYIKRHHELEE